MRDRPIYIGLLCWFLIFTCAYGTVESFYMVNSPWFQNRMKAIPLPHQFQEAQYILGFAVPLVCAIFMSQGANWARILYIGWGIANYLVLAIVAPNRHDFFLPDLPIFAIFAILLLLPAPREYFLLPPHYT